MKILIAFSIILVSLNACSQTSGRPNSDKYDLRDYQLFDSLSIDNSGYFLKRYRSVLDTGLLLKEYYIDPERKIITIQIFIKNNLYDGPVYYYANFLPERSGKISVKGNYAKGKKDGIWINYDRVNFKPEKEYFYNAGAKTGIWKYFDSTGAITKTEDWSK